MTSYAIGDSTVFHNNYIEARGMYHINLLKSQYFFFAPSILLQYSNPVVRVHYYLPALSHDASAE